MSVNAVNVKLTPELSEKLNDILEAAIKAREAVERLPIFDDKEIRVLLQNIEKSEPHAIRNAVKFLLYSFLPSNKPSKMQQLKQLLEREEAHCEKDLNTLYFVMKEVLHEMDMQGVGSQKA